MKGPIRISSLPADTWIMCFLDTVEYLILVSYMQYIEPLNACSFLLLYRKVLMYAIQYVEIKKTF